MKQFLKTAREMRLFLIFWFTQALSGLGSAMTSYALVIRSYTMEGSALKTALLMVCSYAPYVLFSLFAGAISDRWSKKRILLLSDLAAAGISAGILVLLKAGSLRMYQLYLLNMLSGILNTFQQPASEVVITAILPREHYQRVGGLKYLSSSASGILTPVLATAFLGLFGIESVIAFDLVTFAAAFFSLLLLIPVPKAQRGPGEKESLLQSASVGIRYLKTEKGILHLIGFLAAINLVASMYNAVFPAMMLTRGDEYIMGIVNSVIGISMLLGSAAASLLKTPKSRVKSIWLCLTLSMCTENLFLALGRNVYMWSIGAFLGWMAIPFMNANLDAIFRLTIPEPLQGRVYAARNSLQFFTIPIGYLLGGALTDYVFAPVMENASGVWKALFGSGKGGGCALFFFILWLAGISVCLLFRKNRHILRLDGNQRE